MRRSQRLDVSPSTIATWIGAHKEHTTFRCRRAEATKIYPPEQTIRSIKLYHRQVYAFTYHRSKLTLLRGNPQHQRSLASFPKKVPASCPDDLNVSTEPTLSYKLRGSVCFAILFG
jgi:hypothetical protein